MGDAVRGAIDVIAQLQSDLAATRAERDQARSDQKAAEDSNDALLEKVRSLAAHETCACSYDHPGEVCMHHSPALLRAQEEAAQLRARLQEAEQAAEAMRDACLKAALSASYGPPSSWPGDYPKGWRHPPSWGPDEKPSPTIAAWHDNGARDAWFAIRTLAAKTAPLPSPRSDDGGQDGPQA